MQHTTTIPATGTPQPTQMFPEVLAIMRLDPAPAYISLHKQVMSLTNMFFEEMFPYTHIYAGLSFLRVGKY